MRLSRYPIGFAVLSLLLLFVSTMTLTPAASAQSNAVRINEVQSANQSTIDDAAGSSPDWIELLNTSGSAVDLSGWSLTDTPGAPQLWTFPAGTTIDANSTLLVFASGDDLAIDGEFHTNFKLSSSGEFVGLSDAAGARVDSIDPLPPLPTDVSWGVSDSGVPGFFDMPTPNAPNGATTTGFLDDPIVSPERGVYESPIEITMTADPGVSIYYTLDGNEPSALVGELYTAPITISSTTVLRAVEVLAGWTSAAPVTNTYIFPSDIADQPAMQPLPAGTSRLAIERSMSALPVISLTAGHISEVELDANGDPLPTWSQEDDLPVAVEMIHPDGTPGFQVDAGAHEVGYTSVSYAKDSLRLKFGSSWGEPSLDYPVFDGADNPASPATTEFKRLTLRSGAHDTGFWDVPHIAPYRSYLRTGFHDDTMLDLGHVGPHNRHVNVFMNGDYWGMYTLREHFDDHFMASYFGGKNDDYVGINRGELTTGPGSSWATLQDASNSWAEFSQIVNPTNYIDFMLVTEYGGNTWDVTLTGNWRGAGPAIAGAPGYHFMHSDPDISLVSTTASLRDSLRPYGGPANSWFQLHQERDPDFLALVAERINVLFTGSGALTPSAAQTRWIERSSVIHDAIHAEHARWVSRSPGVAGVITPQQWEASVDWLTNVHAPVRTDRVLEILEELDAVPQSHLGQAGVATHSSTHSRSDPRVAIDGVTVGDWEGRMATTTNEAEPWWQVDLGSVESIDSVRVWNRANCCQERLTDFYVFVSNEPFTGDTLAEILEQPGVAASFFEGPASLQEQFPIERSARYVRVQLAGTGTLALAEVEIFGQPVANQPPTIDIIPDLRANSGAAVSYAVQATDPEGDPITFASWLMPPELTIDSTTGVITGTIARSVSGVRVSATSNGYTVWSEPFAALATVDHLGLTGTATQVTDAYGGTPERAIDGVTSGQWGIGSVSHTTRTDDPWWEVDLGSVESIGAIRVFNRTDCCSIDLSDFHVFVSDDPFESTSLAETQAQAGVSDFHFPGTAGDLEEFLIDRSGRYVRVQIDGNAPLMLAEVEIFEGVPLVAGDVNCNQTVEADDAQSIVHYLVATHTDGDACGLINPANGELVSARGDVDDDTNVDIVDALMIAQCAAGTPNALCP